MDARVCDSCGEQSVTTTWLSDRTYIVECVNPTCRAQEVDATFEHGPWDEVK